MGYTNHVKKSKVKSGLLNIKNTLLLKTYLFGILSSSILIPLIVFAQKKYTQDLFGIFEYAKDIIDDIVLWLFTTGAVAYFLYLLAKGIYNIATGNEGADGRKKMNNTIIYGLIALTLMFTFYAVSSLIAVTFGIQIGIPQFFRDQDGLSPGSGQIQNTRSIIDY